MPFRFRVFEWLIYSSLAVFSVHFLREWSGSFSIFFSGGGLIILAAGFIIPLTWIAAREGKRNAAWFLLILVVILLSLILYLFPLPIEDFWEDPGTLITAVGALMAITAFGFYFSGDIRALMAGRREKLLGPGRSYHLRFFEWSMYGALVFLAVENLRELSLDALGTALMLAIMAILTWAAARRAIIWCALVLVVFAIALVVSTVGEIWTGAPSWMRPEAPDTTLGIVLVAVAALLAVAALGVYFIGLARAGVSQAAIAPAAQSDASQLSQNSALPRTNCANCTTPLVGPYCHKCSQSSAPTSIGIRDVIRDAVYMSFKIDQKSLRTLRALLLSPGKLALAHRNGIVVPYTRPFQLTFVISFVVLLVFTFSDWRSHQTVLYIDKPDAHVTRDADGFVRLSGARIGHIAFATRQFQQKVPPGFLASLEHELAQENDEQNATLLRHWKAVATNDPRWDSLGKVLPLLYLAFAPFLAVLLTLFFWGKRYMFVDNLVFAVHIHCFGLLLPLLFVPISYLRTGLGVIHMLLTLWVVIIAYIVIGVRTFYRVSWPEAAFKGVVLGVMEGFLFWQAYMALLLGGMFFLYG